jgi:hypothetical protein
MLSKKIVDPIEKKKYWEILSIRIGDLNFWSEIF